MNLLDKHKALLITLLISGTVVLAMFSLQIKKAGEFITESYYEIEPQTIEELKALEDKLLAKEASKTNTNEAFNEDQEFKEMMQNFKSVSSNDFEKTTEIDEKSFDETSKTTDDVITSNSDYNSSKAFAVQEKERQSFNKANDILAMHSNKKSDDDTKANRSSSVSFSLRNRSKVKLPPPVYLCEVTGKIVVNITVDSNGLVTDTYINSSSSSDNQCLIDHAIEYAENAIFSSDATTKSQIGSITYYFKGKG
ncbi:hypothetical protein [Psychroserpens ponticola]|uniref:Energy transducer TonB n=1 Tax=Psychroserpens ponticola TaxID=2932268 RepID=A0ABY7RW85_9FLAO|nr:hypothetical protein [Psychroserpens ponticola]WCO01409.1 hypothetical protein MUN68_015255 [Psychroserpens ponticola]